MSNIHKQGRPQWLRGKESSCIRSQGWEDALEKEMATHASILARGNPMDTGAWRATVCEVPKELDMI